MIDSTQKVRLCRAFVEPGAVLRYQPASGAAQPLAYGPAATRPPNPGQTEVLETAARHGAVGVLLAAARPGAHLPDFPQGVVSAIGPGGRVAVSRSYAPGSVQLVGSVSAATLQQSFAGAATD